MLDLGTLAAHIKLDGAEGVKTSLSGLADSVSSTAEKFGIQLPEGFNSAALAAAGITAAVVAVGKALFDCASEVAAYGDEIDKNSQKMGISSTAYQEWSYVLERNGSSIDTLQVGMKTLNKQIDAGSEAFDTLGVSLTNADGSMRSSEDIMNDTLHALANMEEGTERTALTTELFGGKVAQDLNPMLNAGAESMDELAQRANDLGGVMSEEGVASSAAFQDAMTDLNLAMTGIKNTIGVAVMPAFTAVINILAQVIAVVGQVVSAIVSGIGSAIGVIGNFASAVSTGISNVIQWFKDLPQNIKTAFGNLSTLLSDAGRQIIEGFLNGLKQKYEEVKGFVSGIGSWIKEHKGPEDYDKNLLVENGQWIMEGLEKGLESSIPSLRRTLNGISGIISGTDFNASAQLAYGTVGGTSTFGARQETTYNVYINGTKINDDVAIESKFTELMMMLARKGSM